MKTKIPTYRELGEIARLADGLLDGTLPAAEWTHAAHLAATLYLIRELGALHLEAELPGIIRRYNESQGGKNTDTEGYHETITQFYIKALKAFNSQLPPNVSTVAACNLVVRSPLGDKRCPLRFYTAELLFSVESRRNETAPDLAPLSFDDLLPDHSLMNREIDSLLASPVYAKLLSAQLRIRETQRRFC